MFRASDNNLSFVSIKLQLVSVGIVGDDVQGTLQATGAVGEQVGIISNTDSSCTDGTEIKAKAGTVEREKTGIYVNFEVTACSHMALPVTLVLLHFPAELVLQLDVALSALVGILAVA